MRSRIIVTGATGAMGSAAVRALAERGHAVVMACRNPDKAAAVRERILADQPAADLTFARLDLSSQDSIHAFVAKLGGGPISALFNNAGVISRAYGQTPDGLEQTFAVNYFGPVLLTRLLLPRLEPDARIVNMVSLTCRFVRISEQSIFPEEKDFSQLGTYACSKLALLHFSQELSRRNPSLRINLADPGIVNSDMISLGRWFDPLANMLFRPFCKSPARGVRPALAALASDERDRYFVGKRVLELPDRFFDPELDLRLWEATDRVLF